MDLELKGKIAVVTGGTRGIGKAAARSLAGEGMDVAIIGRDLEAAKATASEIAGETGRTVRAYSADTGKDDAVRAAVAAIRKDFGRIDVLVNSAAQPSGQAKPPSLSEITDEIFWNDVNVKVMGYLRMAREIAPLMAEQGWGRIINISGLGARQTGTTVGSIRNVGVAALTKNLADELGPKGINVTCVHPGLTRTEKTPGVIEWRAGVQKKTKEEVEKAMNDLNTIRRLVTAEEIGHIVAFLASPKSIAINGDAIAAGGGIPGSIYY
ncbi:MAG: SDR family oxidoreductase [Afipia sp.]|jgi:NAD(P)-dependent dehydrogenase (short-subunit alcohol dehydrogenase family)|nr:SDR family oxidoreductase [Afipia sp.]